MEGQHELNLICGHSVAAVSANDSAQRRCACNVQPPGRRGTYCKMNEPNNVKMVLKRPHHVLYLFFYGIELNFTGLKIKVKQPRGSWLLPV